LNQGQVIRTLSGHKSEVLALALTPDGEQLASASQDGEVMLWNLPSGEPGAVLTHHGKPVTGISFSADGQLLASKSADVGVRLWRRRDWKQVAALVEPHSDFAFAGLAFHPDSPVLATLGDKDCLIRIWDLDLTTWFDHD